MPKDCITTKEFDCEAKGRRNRAFRKWRSLAFLSLQILAYWLLGCRANAKDNALVFDVNLDFYRVPQASPEASYRIAFSVASEGNKWRLDYRENPGRFSAANEGYVIEKPDYQAGEEWRIISPLSEGNPIDLDQEQRLVWFVYGAKKYIQARIGLPVVLPFGDARLDGYAHGCRAEGKWRLPEDICPEYVEFLFDRALYTKGVQQLSWLDNNNSLEQRRKSFDQFLAGHTNGMVIGTLLVSAYTNAAGLGIPASWEFQLNWYGSLLYRCVGRTLSVRQADNIEAVTIPSIVKITDKRVRSENIPIDSVTYSLTNAAQIPNVEDVVVQKQVQHLTPSDPRGFSRMPRHLPRPRWPVVAMLCITISLPIILWIRSKKLRSYTDTKT